MPTPPAKVRNWEKLGLDLVQKLRDCPGKSTKLKKAGANLSAPAPFSTISFETVIDLYSKLFIYPPYVKVT